MSLCCEISTTMNIKYWPIYLEPSGDVNKKGVEVQFKTKP